jgi:spore coat protein A, manganese oxidase
MQTRLKMVRSAAALVFALALSQNALAAQNLVQTPLAGKGIPQFVQPLPQLSLQPGTGLQAVPTFDLNTGAPLTSFTTPLEIRICEFKANILPAGALGKGVAAPSTWVWGYVPGTACPDPNTPLDTYLGPVLVNLRDVPSVIRFTNALPTIDKTNVLAYKYGTDQTLHWADPDMKMCNTGAIPTFGSDCSFNFGEGPRGVFNTPEGIPATPHLHGGEVPAVLDGGPDSWFNSTGTAFGHDYYTAPASLGVTTAPNQAVYAYPNKQAAAPIWFHDHTLGATRLNVYAGIAGGYYILDPTLESYLAGIKMRPVTEVVPIILQDRQFDTTGQLYFPSDSSSNILWALNPEHPYWVPEFIGDVAVVNGRAWPFMNVEPRRYRFLFLNGSNARTYELFLTNPVTKVNGPVMWAIGNDAGFLDAPALVDPNAAGRPDKYLAIMPGERYEMIIDFSNYAGQTLVLKNVAKAPYPGGMTPTGGMDKILQFRVACPATGCVADTTYDPAKGIALRPTPLVRIATTTGAVGPGVTLANIRSLTLNEVLSPPRTAIDPVTGLTTAYPGGPLEILVNNTRFSGESKRTYGDFKTVTIGGLTEFVSEAPTEGDTELWEIVNTTADAHPIHTHLFTFQILNRQNYNVNKYLAAYGLAFPGDGPGGVCAAGVYCPGFGPPLRYDSGLTRLFNNQTLNVLGGNVDVTPFLANLVKPADPDEAGWKDTVMAPPGMVTRIIARFAPTEIPVNAPAAQLGYPFYPNDSTNPSDVYATHGYVWHCHIIDHEDNEMMRPDVFLNNPAVPAASRTYLQGTNY